MNNRLWNAAVAGIKPGGGALTWLQAVNAVNALYTEISEGELFYTHDGLGNPANYYTDAGVTLVSAVNDLVYRNQGQRLLGTGYNLDQATTSARPLATNEGIFWGAKAGTGDFLRNVSIPAAARLSGSFVVGLSGYYAGNIDSDWEVAVFLRTGAGNDFMIGRDRASPVFGSTPYGWFIYDSGATPTAGALEATLTPGQRFYIYAEINPTSQVIDFNGTEINRALNIGDSHTDILFLNNPGGNKQMQDAYIDSLVLIDQASADKDTILNMLTWAPA